MPWIYSNNIINSMFCYLDDWSVNYEHSHSASCWFSDTAYVHGPLSTAMWQMINVAVKIIEGMKWKNKCEVHTQSRYFLSGISPCLYNLSLFSHIILFGIYVSTLQYHLIFAGLTRHFVNNNCLIYIFSYKSGMIPWYRHQYRHQYWK